jgi:hypothetical protein
MPYAPITVRALVQRINRKLAKQSEKLIKARGQAARANLGDWYVVNTDKKTMVLSRVDPEKLARKLGVLEGWEQVTPEA